MKYQQILSQVRKVGLRPDQQAILELLDASQWKVARVVPYGGTDWIDEIWFPAMREAILAGANQQAECESETRAKIAARGGKELPRLDVDLPTA